MINYIAGLKSSIGMKFVVTVISLLTFLILISYGSVSYTHLDVYKRQSFIRLMIPRLQPAREPS